MLSLNPDYIGWYYSSSKEVDREILMADPQRYEMTSSNLRLKSNDHFFITDFECLAEVRPYETKTYKQRLDIYINLDYSPQIIDYFTQNGAQEVVYAKGTNSSDYNKGNMHIPINAVGPKLNAKNLEITSPKWSVSLDNYVIYTDIETGEGRGQQLHLGIDFKSATQQKKEIKQNEGEIVNLNGSFEIPIDSINTLYSFLLNYIRLRR